MTFDFIYNYPKIARDSGLKLRQFRDGPLDWKIIGSVEVDRILCEQQFEHIDAILFHLSEAPLASLLESNVLDSGISKYFILSQFSIQYLIFCRKFLDESVKTLRKSLTGAEHENNHLKQVNQEHNNEIQQLQKKIIQMEAVRDIVFPCHMCTKNFVSNEALNVHLSRKHLKHTHGEFQDHDNDRTLINTIKLELEIKQLKERLNTAEKDIRQTFESKKGSPKHVNKISLSTQVNILTKDIGTQSNLSDLKEKDCLEDGKNDNYQILTQLNEKISYLETFQENQCIQNQRSILDISQKLSEITTSLKCRSEKDVDNLTKLAKDAISSSLSSKQFVPTAPLANEFQSILSNTVTEVLHLNSNTLNEILDKIKDICDEKLPSLEVKMQKGEKCIQQTVTTLPFIEAELSPKTNDPPLLDENSIAISLDRRTYSADQCSSIHLSNGEQHDGNSTDISVEIKESENNNDPFKATHTTKSIDANHDRGMQVLTKNMGIYGINAKVRSISSPKALNIAEHLAERRNALKKTYPRFYACRNKLKDLVNTLSHKTLNELQDQHTDNKTTEQRIDIKRPSISTNVKHSELFETRIEKILNSPVKKPETCLKGYAQPIPLPRKRVMFSTKNQ